jgi:rhamnogalacturonyl hydrolase YesR
MKKLTSLIRVTLVAGLFLATAGSAFATVTLAGASGGGYIPADTASNAPAPAWTTLGAITITEGASTDFTNGTGVTLILKAPAGFQFNTAVTPNITFTTNKNIQSASVAMTDSSNITVTLTVSGTAVATDSLTIGSTTGIQVRPTAGVPLATGKHIYRPSTGGGTAGIRGITNSVDGSTGSSFGILTEAPGTPSATMPSQTQILSDMTLANNYFTNEWPTPGCSTCLSGSHPSSIWTRATYFEGSLAMWRINHDPAITNYATGWGTFHNWTIRGGATDTSPDDQCAGSEFIELYLLNTTLTNRITNIVANLNCWMFTNSTTTNWWWYIDGVHMSMPAFAKMAAISGGSNTNYAYKMYSYWHYTKSTLAPSNGLYNLTDHLWCRDSNYLANYKASDGTTQKCYWSRGNGWVFAGLARVLDVLPSSDTNFTEYLQTFQQMAAALKSVQRSDGFWNMNLAYTNDYPGPESSGTAMFTYGLAWGIHHGYLDAATYLPTVIKGWNGLTTSALHHSPSADPGFIGFVQSSGASPTNNPAITYTSVPDFDDFTLGALLLAGSEIYQLTNLSQTITFGALANHAYGDAPMTLSASASSGLSVSFSILSGPASLAGNILTITGAGTVAVRATQSGNANYAATNVDQSFTVNPVALMVSANPTNKVYGDADPVLTWQLTGGSLVTGDSFTGGLTRAAGENAGAHAILQGTLTAGSNYNLTYTGANLTISQKSMTVTADNKMKTQGLANPPLTAQYDGFVNSENTNAFTTQVALSTTADANSPSGTTYPITPSGAAAVNYSFSYIAGTLTVLAKPDLAGISAGEDQYTLTWPTIVGQNYQVEYKDNLDDPAWTPLGVLVTGTGNPLNVDDNNNYVPHRFYRLLITQP